MSIARRIPLLVWIVVPVALAALVAWPLGGWDTVRLVSRELPAYSSTQVFDSHRYDVRVESAYLTSDAHPAGYSAPDPPDFAHFAQTYLVAQLEVTNVTHEPTSSSELSNIVVPVIEGAHFNTSFDVDYVLAQDHTTGPELNPGLSRELFMVWKVPAAAVHAGDRVHFDLYQGTVRKALLSYGDIWFYDKAGYADRMVSER